ncbi:D-xylose-proton symporter-like protein 2, partial [Tanacetum coccineum]
ISSDDVAPPCGSGGCSTSESSDFRCGVKRCRFDDDFDRIVLRLYKCCSLDIDGSIMVDAGYYLVHLETLLGAGILFFIFGGIAAVSLVFIFFIVQEKKGLTLEEIEAKLL